MNSACVEEEKTIIAFIGHMEGIVRTSSRTVR